MEVLTPEELPTEQTMQVTERIKVNRNVEDTIRQEVPAYEEGQLDQELPVMELNGVEEGERDETS